MRSLLVLCIVGLIFVSCSKGKKDSKASITTEVRTTQKSDSPESVLDSLLKTSGFQVDTTSHPEHELSRLIKRYQKIDQLYTKHKSMRDSLRPLFWEICPQYWKLRNKIARINEPVHKAILDSLVAQPSKEEANSVFLKTLIEQRKDTSLLAIEQALAPIFKVKADSVGIYIDAITITPPPEGRLLENTSYKEDIRQLFPPYKTLFYKQVLDSLYPTPLKYYIYSNSGSYLSEIRNFGKYEDECLIYYYYDIEPPYNSADDEAFLFTSPFELDLVYENSPEVDSLINSQYPGICADCLSSWDKQRTFARLKGYENIYFTYAYEPNKDLDDTHTPLRAVYYVNDKTVINLWGKDIDMFACSCL